jgi:nicotinamide riboside transporter PnuC
VGKERDQVESLDRREKMKNSKQDTSDWLSALTIMGRILIFVPVVVMLLSFILSLFGANPVNGESVFAGSTMIFICGAAALFYVAIKKFQQGLCSEIEQEIEKTRTER